MIRANFEKEMQGLNDRMLALGNEVKNNIVTAVEALVARDQQTAEQIIVGDLEINRKRIDIMTDALTLIATQQPMAGDLRLIASIIEIAGELERINDYSKGIAKNSLIIGNQPIVIDLKDLSLMANRAAEMLHLALGAASRNDVDAARSIPDIDDEIDDLFNKIYRDILFFVADDPDSFGSLNSVEWALHNLERAADRVTNICEWVVYTTTGEYIEMDSELEAPPPAE